MSFQSESSVLKFLQAGVDGKHLMSFQSESSVFKFLQCGVDGKHLMSFQSETSVFKVSRCGVDRATPIHTLLRLTVLFRTRLLHL